MEIGENLRAPEWLKNEDLCSNSKATCIISYIVQSSHRAIAIPRALASWNESGSAVFQNAGFRRKSYQALHGGGSGKSAYVITNH